MTPLAGAAAALLALTMAGCSAPPPREKVAERFRIELEAASDGLLKQDNPDVVGLSEDVADNLLDGGCKIDPGLGLDPVENASYIYAVNSTCLMYFESEMSELQVERGKQLLFEQIQHDLEGNQ